MKKIPIVLAVIVAIVVLIALNSYITVKAGHNKVATLFGNVRPEAYGEGFHIVNPLLSFTNFDLRQMTHTWQKVDVPSQDKLKTSMDISVTYRLDGLRTPMILQETGLMQDVLNKHITPKVRSLLREAGKTVAQSQDFYLDIVQQHLQLYMEQGLGEYLEKKGVIVEAVLFRDVTLPAVVTSAVIQTKERQEQLEREKAQLNIVEQQAQQQVKQAEAREQAAISDANAKRTQADAEAYRIIKEAEAQAKANAVLARSITTELIQYNSIQRWTGQYPQTLMMGAEMEEVIISLPDISGQEKVK
ncbi:MAG: prohibitin family protein [Gammaproteobacteria bacterium]|nr:MAG: prohibitin family protein [Gammaproteobacteria bacterium]